MTDLSTGRPSVVVVGGGYGGINAAKALDDVADVTLVDPTEAFVHNIAAWRALVEPEWLDRIFLPYAHLLANGRFVRDRAVAVDGRRVTLASGDVLEPDYLVLATGSSYPFPAKTEEPDIASRPIPPPRGSRGAARRRPRVDRRRRSRRAGARRGDQGVLPRQAGDDRRHRAGHPRRSLRPGAARRAAPPARALGIELRLGAALSELPAPRPRRSPRSPSPPRTAASSVADIWFRAFGVRPHSEYLEGGSLDDRRDERGYVRVDEQLRVVGETSVFALGDVADADRDMAGIATAQAEVVATNVRSADRGQRRAHVLGAVPAADRDPARARGRSGLHRRRRRRQRDDRRAQGPPHAGRHLRVALRRRAGGGLRECVSSAAAGAA